jgi:dynein assembly factor with WDR repeat domains 1
MRVKRFLVRYFPPGIILECESNEGELVTRTMDLLDLTAETDLEALISDLIQNEPTLLKEKRRPLIKELLQRLVSKLNESERKTQFQCVNELRTHMLPLTNCAFNKNGTKFITGSYDRTCKMWDTTTGSELATLTGHQNVVYAIAFNNPYGDRICTGSFDRSAKIWDVATGKCLHTYLGHRKELVCVAFSPNSSYLCTGSTDGTARCYDTQTGECTGVLASHTAEVISVGWSGEGGGAEGGHLIMTGSFDNTVRIWDVRMLNGQSPTSSETANARPSTAASNNGCVRVLKGHTGEISACSFDFTSQLCVSGSIDTSVKVWDIASARCVHTLMAHNDEVMDVSFNLIGTKIVSASSDKTAAVFDVMTGRTLCKLTGHEEEISKCAFNPRGNRILTASADQTARLWDSTTGECVQTLEGHSDDIFSCAFNYEGDTIITGSKDNTCRLWKLEKEEIKEES